MRLVLASQSPRRAALLTAAGIPFDTCIAEVDEAPLPDEVPEAYVLRLALAKAQQAACREPASITLGADTTVVVDAQILGKPDDDAHATEMLKLLAGRSHDVLTGVALARDDRVLSACATTRVHFLPLTSDEIAWYVASGEPLGKAGAYAIQGLGSRFVDRIEGSYSNVVGLPVSQVYRLLVELGWSGSAAPNRPGLSR